MSFSPVPETTIPKPGLYFRPFEGSDSRRRSGCGALFGVVAVAIGALGMWSEWKVGFAGRSTYNFVPFPTWIAWAIALLFGLLALLGSSSKWGRPPWRDYWCLVAFLDEREGLRLFAGRLGEKHPGVLVLRGETVSIDARLVRQTVKGVATYEYVVSAPGGILAFRAEGRIESLTMARLVERALARGVRVTTSGAATAIDRDSRPKAGGGRLT